MGPVWAVRGTLGMLTNNTGTSVEAGHVFVIDFPGNSLEAVPCTCSLVRHAINPAMLFYQNPTQKD